MSDDTPLDALQRAMEAAPDDEVARRSYFARLLAQELVLLLDAPPGRTVSPRLVEIDGQMLALAFDGEARLAAFAGAADYAALSGRDLAALLAGHGLGLGLNLGGEGAPLHLAAQDVAWLAEQGVDAQPDSGRIAEIMPPRPLTAELLAVLDARLATLAGLAEAAYLVGARMADGQAVLLLVVTGAAPSARARIAGSIAEALRVAAMERPLDVVFAGPGDPLLLPALRHGIRIDLPGPEAPEPVAPGSDPSKPPRLH